MEKLRELYLNPNGQDMWLTLDVDRKQIKALDILTRNETTYPFLTKKDTRENYQCWLENSELRLPRTFVIKAEEFTRNFIGSEIKSLGLPLPSKNNLKEFVVYHKSQDGYVHINIENFTNTILPIIDSKWIRKLVVNQIISRQNKQEYQVEGVFTI